MCKHPEMFIQVAGEIRALPVPDHTITTVQLMEYGHNPYGIAPQKKVEASMTEKVAPKQEKTKAIEIE